MKVQIEKKIIPLFKTYFDMTAIKKTFTLLKPFILKQQKAYCVLFILLGIDIFLTIGFAWFFGNIMDAAVHSDFERMKSLILVGIGLFFLSLTSNYLNIFYETVATNGVKRDLKNHLFHHILRLPASKATDLSSGELLSHFTNDIHSLNGVIGYSLINLIRLPLVYVTVFIYLFQINATLTISSTIITPMAILGGVIFGLLLRKNSREIHSLNGRITSILSETFLGFFVIRSFTLEKLIFLRFAKKNSELYELEIQNAKLQGWFALGGQIIGSITFYFSLCLGAYYVFKGILTVGALLTFVNLVNHLVYPVTGITGQWAGFQRSVAAIERILKILEEPADTEKLPSYTFKIRSLNSIQFQNITFSYDENKKLFQEFNLSIQSGKKIAFVGPSGAGKSTLFSLLQNFYKPQSGKILIDGTPTEDLTISELRSSIAHVHQDTFLFSGTIRENLMIARQNITEEEMIQASLNAKIHDFILTLPSGYETEIGERGIKLSGGQKQRLAIARALLKDAPILLLDEATSALDSETEFYVKVALEELTKERTTLIIAHRLSTVQNADLIVVMDKGKIVQMGNHEELVNVNGLYQILYKSQFQNKKNLSQVSNV